MAISETKQRTTDSVRYMVAEVWSKSLRAGAVVFRLLVLFALHAHLALVGAFAEMVGGVVRGCRAAFWTFETVALAVTSREWLEDI